MINKNLLMIGILVVLILGATVQAIQLINIKSDMKNIGTGTTIKKTTTSASNAKPVSGSSTVPTNLQNLPGMVGGC